MTHFLNKHFHCHENYIRKYISLSCNYRKMLSLTEYIVQGKNIRFFINYDEIMGRRLHNNHGIWLVITSLSNGKMYNKYTIYLSHTVYLICCKFRILKIYTLMRINKSRDTILTYKVI